ncbi:hypothetical protein ITJ38_10065 [Agreia pratensis]|uniref:hypothetical protein n=1 Tax=Agreia pratensis TaxID=150121 RepID=UPI00188AE7FD|nr:hypothetical protein [Agreia pratensis]MBF4634745.1 hypothetical protein [Agreia pratensis]
MARRRAPSAPDSPRASIDDLASLRLDPTTCLEVGVLRASFDAVKKHPLVMDDLATARAINSESERIEALSAHANASGALAARTAAANRHFDLPPASADSGAAPF